jgi:hypothetical protein
VDKELFKDITKDIWKYILVGGLGFAISSIYQAWTLKPENNITIFPLSVSLDKSSEGKTFCMVDARAATEFSRKIPQESDMSKYISSLLQSQSFPVDIGALDAKALKSKAPEVFINCGNANLLPVPKSILSVALIMKEPTPYLLDKDCNISFSDNGAITKIPARVSVAGKSSPFVFNNTDVLSINYNPADPSAKDSPDMKSIDELERQLKKGEKRDTQLGISCQVAQKRAWYEFGKKDNYTEVRSGLEKVRSS